MPQGSYKPAAVKALARAVERHCAMHGVTGQDDRDAIAIKALEMYRKGVTDEDGLLAFLEREAKGKYALPDRQSP